MKKGRAEAREMEKSAQNCAAAGPVVGAACAFAARASAARAFAARAFAARSGSRAICFGAWPGLCRFHADAPESRLALLGNGTGAALPWQILNLRSAWCREASICTFSSVTDDLSTRGRWPIVCKPQQYNACSAEETFSCHARNQLLL